MKTTFHLLIYLLLLNKSLFAAENGVCSIKSKSGIPRNVCCADFEEINSECKPCSTGYFSNIGEICQPCAPNAFGNLCSGECNCNEFERCDSIHGCVERRMTEVSTKVDQTSSYTEKDFPTSTKVSTSSKRITTVNDVSGLSSREIIVFYILSAAVLILLILLICLCLVILKNKRKKRERSIISNSGPESRNQTDHNNDQSGIEEYSLYDVIDDTEIGDIEVKPKPNLNNYLEVVHESTSSNSSDSGKPEPDGYLNPYQPLCFSTEDIRSSYERLQTQTIETLCNSENRDCDLQDQNSCIGLTLSTLPTSYDIEVKPKSNHNDYLEVVDELTSCNRSHSGKPERNSYLNTFQPPCVSTENIRSSFERLQMQTIETPSKNEKTNADLQDQECCKNLTLSTSPSSYDIEVKPNSNYTDYLEVVDELTSCNRSHSGKPERNSYLNTSQPLCVSTENIRSSFERLQMQTVENPSQNEKTGPDLQDQL